MLFKQNNRPAIKGIILTSLLTLLAGCGNSEALESLVSADPQLKQNKSEQDRTNRNLSQSSPIEKTDRPTASPSKVTDTDNQNKPSSNTSQSPVSQVSNLPFNFPGSFPVYPKAQLQEIKSEGDDSGMLVWNSTDNRKAIADYYQAELSTNGWDVIKPFNINSQSNIARAIAVKDDLRVELSLSPGAKSDNNTELTVVYHPVGEEIPKSSIARSLDSAQTESKPSTSSSETIKDDADKPIPENYLNSSDKNFADLNEVPEQLQQPLESVSALGILTPYTGDANVELSKFAPNQAVTRAEYARWLLAANNRYYSDNPGKKIYVAAKNAEPAFKDVPPSHPDFVAIQSLAEAGLIPSRLTKDSTNILFRPDASLTREDLVTWKVPLDTRQSLPKASIEAVEESWGFQDVANIDSSAVRALYADFQNGDRSNVRRVFGYTTLFQPKKPVTRAEAAASLGYFGFQGDGITAQEVLESQTNADSLNSSKNAN